MSEQSPFVYPPFFGNAVADVVYYAVFLAIQIGLGLRYVQRWNWPILLNLVIFLIFEVLGSVAYLELSYAPFTGSWYALWIFAFTAGPVFFISSLHLCAYRALQDMRSVGVTQRVFRISSSQYLAICLGIDSLSLVLTVIGTTYAGIQAPRSPDLSQRGFDIMVAAMVVQLCSIIITLGAGVTILVCFRKDLHRSTSDTKTLDVPYYVEKESKNPRFPIFFLAGLLFTGILLFGWALIRAIDLAGGLHGPLSQPLLVNIETIFLFVAILLFSALHPTFHLQNLANETF